MRQTQQFLGLMACGILLAGVLMLIVQAISGGFGPRGGGAGFSGRSAIGIDYLSFGVGLAFGLMLAEIARLSWADMPRRLIAWIIANRRNAKYCGYACIWLVVLIYV